ncbi:PD-(D/E)XK nuclease family protein, partial [Ameyamaea chiangmaiensis]
SPVQPPAPRPPLAWRPRRLSVTEIETWLGDPYAIYARHVLGLRALAPLEESADASDFGTIVHEVLEACLKTHVAAWPDRIGDELAASFDRVLNAATVRPALRAWWRPRLHRIAHWVAEAERDRRVTMGAPRAIAVETRGEVTLNGLEGGPFRLRGRADRIDVDAEGRAHIVDYKTGQLPARKAVVAGWSPQLVLEAAMLAHGGFPDLDSRPTRGLLYWRLSGAHKPGEALPIALDESEVRELAERTWENLRALIERFDDPDQAYYSHPRPGREPRYNDYAQLARVAEWSGAAREDEP